MCTLPQEITERNWELPHTLLHLFRYWRSPSDVQILIPWLFCASTNLTTASCSSLKCTACHHPTAVFSTSLVTSSVFVPSQKSPLSSMLTNLMVTSLDHWILVLPNLTSRCHSIHFGTPLRGHHTLLFFPPSQGSL